MYLIVRSMSQWHTVVFIVIATLRPLKCGAQLDNSIVDYSTNNNNLNYNFTWDNFNFTSLGNNNNNNNNLNNTLFGSLFPAFVLPELPSLFATVTATTKTTTKNLVDTLNNLLTTTTTTTVAPARPANQEATVGGASKARASPTFAGATSASNIRLRLNEPFFQETAKFFHGVFSHEVRRVRIQPQRQCFPEGCFESDAFRIVGFRPPAGLTLRPTAPNRLVLSIIGFDVDIVGRIGGNLQLFLTSLPLTGRLLITARQLVLSASFDLQKSAGTHTPFLRMHDCQMRAGHVDTRVADVGLLTDSINLKYKNEVIAKSREMITSTVCEQIERIIQTQVNARLHQIPRRLAVSQILKTLATQPTAAENEENEKKGGDQDGETDGEEAATTKRQNSANPFDLVQEKHRGRYRRDAPTSNLLQTTVKIAKQQPAAGERNELRSRERMVNEPRITVRKSTTGWNTVVLGRESIATIQERTKKQKAYSSSQTNLVIPEQEEEEQQKLIQRQQQYHQSQRSSASQPQEDGVARRQISRKASPVANSGVVTLVESMRHAAPKAHSTNSNKTTTMAAGDSKPIAKSVENVSSTVKNKKYQINDDKEKDKNDDKHSNEYYSEVKATVDDAVDFFDATAVVDGIEKLKFGEKLSDLLEFFDLNSLGRLFVDLDFLDSSAATDAFTVGLRGDALVKTPQSLTLTDGGGEFAASTDGALSRDHRLLAEFDEEAEHQRRRPPRFPTGANGNARRRTLEIVVAEITPNLLLFQAHRARLLKIRVGADAPIFGRLLRTNCGPDEVCLSDSVPEVGERFPGNQQLELVVETMRAPRLVVGKDSATLHFAAAAIFFLAGSRRPIGRLPFVGSAQIRARMSQTDAHRANVGLKLMRLELLDQIDFLGLRRDALDGLCEAVRGALERTARRLLAGGVDTRTIAAPLARYGVGDVALRLTEDGVIYLQADLDVYRFAFETSDSGSTREILIRD